MSMEKKDWCRTCICLPHTPQREHEGRQIQLDLWPVGQVYMNSNLGVYRCTPAILLGGHVIMAWRTGTTGSMEQGEAHCLLMPHPPYLPSLIMISTVMVPLMSRNTHPLPPVELQLALPHQVCSNQRPGRILLTTAAQTAPPPAPFLVPRRNRTDGVAMYISLRMG